MSLLSDLRTRLEALLFRGREEREFGEEARLHLDLEIERNRELGMSDAEARRRAAIAFGGIAQTEEAVRDARGTRGLHDLAGDVAYAVRTLRQRPGFLVAAALTFALGIGGTTAVFSAVDAVLLKPLPYASPGQLVRIYAAWVQQPAAESFVTPVHFLAYRAPSSTLQSIAALNTYDETGADIGAGDDVRRIRTLQVSADYFDVLRVHPALGRGFDRDEENGPNIDEGLGAPVVVLSHRLWLERFHGDPHVVGRSLTMSGDPLTVVGVMPEGFADPIAGRGVEAWIPLDLTTGHDLSNISNHWLALVGRLRPGVSVAQAQAELDVMTERLTEPYPPLRDNRTHLVPLKEDVVGSAGRSLDLMLGAVGLVLLLVCVNVAGLQLVRASERSGEFAVRSALGAGRGRLVRQLLAESLVLAAVGTAAGLVLARLAMSALVKLGASSIPRLAGLGLDVPVLLFAVLVATASAIVFGLVPAWRAGQTNPADALRGTGRANSGDRATGRLRSGLVAAQVALAFVLLAGAGLLLMSFRAVSDMPLGIRTDGVLAFRVHLPEARYDSIARARFYADFDGRIEAIPGVKAAGGVSYLPATGPYHSWGFQVLSGPLVGRKDAHFQAQNRVVTPHYFRALRIPILAGRAFDDEDVAGAPDRVIVSKSVADAAYPGADPLGQQLSTGGRTSTIVGVVPDVALDAEGDLSPYVYHAHAQFAGDRNWALYEVVSTSGEPTALVPAIRSALARMDPLLVMDQPAPLTDVIGRGTAQRKFTLLLLVAFAASALVLAALGIFGVLSYVVRLRGQEFGIRIALGASPGAVLAAVLRQGGVVIGVGILIGLAGAAALSRVVASLVFHVSPLDPRALLGAALVLAVFGGVAAYLPARRAGSVDPRTVLQ